MPANRTPRSMQRMLRCTYTLFMTLWQEYKGICVHTFYFSVDPREIVPLLLHQ